ncbi:MAG TPA: SURF1 family protein [Steroidobacteraceae bacterium]
MPLTLEIGRCRWSASWAMTALTVAALLLFFYLGRWQWHRGQQRQALEQQFMSGATSVNTLDGRSTAALPRYSEVRLDGRYDGDHQFLLDNMSHEGRPGYQVLTPLHLSDGRTVIVNRGWIPAGISRRQLPDVHLDEAGRQTPIGRLDDLPVAGIALGHAAPPPGPAWPKLTSFPTMADLSSTLALSLQSRQLLLDPSQPLGYLRDWHVGGMGAMRHLSYALQWWAFGALALGLYGYMNLQRRPP